MCDEHCKVTNLRKNVTHRKKQTIIVIYPYEIMTSLKPTWNPYTQQVRKNNETNVCLPYTSSKPSAASMFRPNLAFLIYKTHSGVLLLAVNSPPTCLCRQLGSISLDPRHLRRAVCGPDHWHLGPRLFHMGEVHVVQAPWKPRWRPTVLLLS